MSQFFDLYTSRQEYKSAHPDQFSRARYYDSVNRRVFDPVVSEQIYAAGLKPHYPGNKQFAVCVSHDIDHLFLHQNTPRKLLNAGKRFLRGRIGQGFDQLGSIVKEKVYQEYDLRKLIGINDSRGIRSSYYFLSLGPGDQDFNYDPSAITEQLQAIIRSNNEIGLHGGHLAYNSYDKLIQEKDLLERSAGLKLQGYRNHYLRLELPTTWNNLEKAGFSYDTTLGYADCIGFRNGMCYPHYPFDVTKGQFLEIVELPLIIMDATLFFYMRMDFEGAFKICREIMEKVMACNGVLTLLWHNNFISEEMGAFYARILDLLRAADPWFSTSSELITWWKSEGLLDQSRSIITEILKEQSIKY